MNDESPIVERGDVLIPVLSRTNTWCAAAASRWAVDADVGVIDTGGVRDSALLLNDVTVGEIGVSINGIRNPLVVIA